MDMRVVEMAAGVFVFGVVAYVAFMIFVPELVGITGKKAREAQAAHRGDQANEQANKQASGPGSEDKIETVHKNKDENQS